jgi:hypothetical protein
MFTQCSLNIHSIFTQYSLNVHSMFTQCSLNISGGIRMGSLTSAQYSPTSQMGISVPSSVMLHSSSLAPNVGMSSVQTGSVPHRSLVPDNQVEQMKKESAALKAQLAAADLKTPDHDRVESALVQQVLPCILCISC